MDAQRPGGHTADVHLAQLNVGTMVAPTDDPQVAEFMDALDRVNALADDAPGFVWRLQTDDGNATSIQIFPDPLQLVNMSVWETIDDLKSYVYRSEHVEFFRRRAEWFERDAKRVALWWIPAGTEPDLADAVRRVEFLERHGPSPYAFSFARPAEPLLVSPTAPDDHDAAELLAALDRELGGAPTTIGSTLDPDSVRRADGTFLVAHVDDTPVACGAIRRGADGVGEISHVYVAPEARGRKVGAAVIDRLEAAAVHLELGEIVVATAAQHDAAIALFEGAGYARTERRRGHSDTAALLVHRKVITGGERPHSSPRRVT